MKLTTKKIVICSLLLAGASWMYAAEKKMGTTEFGKLRGDINKLQKDIKAGKAPDEKTLRKYQAELVRAKKSGFGATATALEGTFNALMSGGYRGGMGVQEKIPEKMTVDELKAYVGRLQQHPSADFDALVRLHLEGLRRGRTRAEMTREGEEVTTEMIAKHPKDKDYADAVGRLLGIASQALVRAADLLEQEKAGAGAEEYFSSESMNKYIVNFDKASKEFLDPLVPQILDWDSYDNVIGNIDTMFRKSQEKASRENKYKAVFDRYLPFHQRMRGMLQSAVEGNLGRRLGKDDEPAVGGTGSGAAPTTTVASPATRAASSAAGSGEYGVGGGGGGGGGAGAGGGSSSTTTTTTTTTTGQELTREQIDKVVSNINGELIKKAPDKEYMRAELRRLENHLIFLRNNKPAVDASGIQNLITNMSEQIERAKSSLTFRNKRLHQRKVT